MLALYMLLMMKVSACLQLFALIAMSTTHLFDLHISFVFILNTNKCKYLFVSNEHDEIQYNLQYSMHQ